MVVIALWAKEERSQRDIIIAKIDLVHNLPLISAFLFFKLMSSLFTNEILNTVVC